MAPFYEEVCRQLNWSVDKSRLATMKSENDKKLKELEEKIKDAEKNLGEIEVRDAYLDKAEFFVSIGDKVYFLLSVVLYRIYSLNLIVFKKECDNFFQLFQKRLYFRRKIIELERDGLVTS